MNPYTDEKYHLMLSIKTLNINNIIDVGANKGQFALEVFAAGYKGRIVSIEPLSSAWAILHKTASDKANWIVFPRCGLGQKQEELVINISSNLDSSSILPMSQAHLNAAPWSKYVGAENCQIFALDDIFGQINSDHCRTLLKIDCQGYEYLILNGATDSLRKIQAVLTEVSIVELYHGQKLWLDIIEYMRSMGFCIYSVFKGFTDPKTGQTLQLDILFTK